MTPVEAHAKAYDDDAKPRVTLVAENLRAVFDPPTGDIIIEKLCKDAVGTDCWGFLDRLASSVPRGDQRMSSSTHFAILTLLANGKKPV